MRSAILLLGISMIVTASGCRDRARDEGDKIFGHAAPQNYNFKKEVDYLESTGQLTKADQKLMNDYVHQAYFTIGVPKSLLWCVLFQESRLDPLKNMNRSKGARGLGQFTRHALKEINKDTNLYDIRTEDVMRSQLGEDVFPISFKLGFRPSEDLLDRRNRSPANISVPNSSYFHTKTAVFASAAYLNNRYNQIVKALEKQNIDYDPEVVWLYAAAAYNKGTKTVFNLLSDQRYYGGDSGLSELMKDAKLSYTLLTHAHLLDHSLRDIFTNDTREKYVKELTKNIELVVSCVTPEIGS
jgi:hypothetical protein